MARTEKSRKTELRKWMDEQYRKSPGLKKRVEALVERMSIEQDLISLREERGLSQRALAALVGVKQPVIARIESGKAKNLELKTVVRIATALGARVRIGLERTESSGRAKSIKRRLAATAPRWTPENRPVVDGQNRPVRSAVPSTGVLPRSIVIEQEPSRR